MKLVQVDSGIFSAETALASALADQFRQLHLRAGGAAAQAQAVAAATREACLAVQDGHVCAQTRLAHAITGSPVVALAPDDHAPLVLSADRLYLQRYWRYERQLAESLRQLNQPLMLADDALPALQALLASLFPDTGTGPDWQRLAAANALSRRLCIISGGPGTGKTTTVVRVMAALLMQQPELRIALAAPTGKAAARLKESIRLQIDKLPIDPALRERLPRDAQTLHRLLGVRRGSVQFLHNARRPLPFDLVIIDEASMLDLALAAKLVDAIGPQTRLVLLGDKDQLASVEAGAVFSEISTPPQWSPQHSARLRPLAGFDPVTAMAEPADNTLSPLCDASVWLQRSYRFARDSGIGRLAAAIRRGDAATALSEMRAGACLWHPHLPGLDRLCDTLINGFADYLDAIREAQTPLRALAAFDRFRVLCAVRGGRYGTDALNEALARSFRRRLEAPENERSPWFVGRPVMITRNDYALQLFNGDIGIALPDAAGQLLVHFPVTDTEGRALTRAIAPGRLSDVQTAFALTVHKAQGSEFERVDLLLDSAANRGLTRELVYTALTRARAGLSIWCEESVLGTAIERQGERRSALFA